MGYINPYLLFTCLKTGFSVLGFPNVNLLKHVIHLPAFEIIIIFNKKVWQF